GGCRGRGASPRLAGRYGRAARWCAGGCEGSRNQGIHRRRDAASATGSYFPATEETYAATAAISCGVSCPLNEGITPLPFVTRSTTLSFEGFASSRFGPTVPVEPASFSV